jgi:hypothetical protein
MEMDWIHRLLLKEKRRKIAKSIGNKKKKDNTMNLSRSSYIADL